jgi:hypothetical protein
MELSLEASRQTGTSRVIEQEVLLKAEVLEHHLAVFARADVARARAVLPGILERLEHCVSGNPDFGSNSVPYEARVSSYYPGAAKSDEIEDFILATVAGSERGLSVQDIVDNLKEAGLEIKRTTLVVRLHRLVRSGKLASRAHGHYVLG